MFRTGVHANEFVIRPSTSPTIRENEQHQHNSHTASMGLRQQRQKLNSSFLGQILGRFVRWARAATSERNGPDYVMDSERLLVRVPRSPCHHTPRLCLSFSPLRSSISNPRHYRHLSSDGQDSPLVTPKPYDRSYTDHPARRPSPQVRTASCRPQFQLI